MIVIKCIPTYMCVYCMSVYLIQWLQNSAKNVALFSTRFTQKAFSVLLCIHMQVLRRSLQTQCRVCVAHWAIVSLISLASCATVTIKAGTKFPGGRRGQEAYINGYTVTTRTGSDVSHSYFSFIGIRESVHKPRSLKRKASRSGESKLGPSAYQPSTLPQGRHWDIFFY